MTFTVHNTRQPLRNTSTVGLPLIVWVQCAVQLDTQSLINLGQTSTVNRKLCYIIFKARLVTQLSKSIGDPDGLLRIIEVNHAVFSGMVVLKALDYFSSWDTNITEVYASNSHWSFVVQDMIEAGYRPIHTRGLCSRIGTVGCAVFATSHSGFVKVYRSANRSAVYPIAFFRHTLLMNYASFDHICIAYPALTLAGRGIVTSRVLDGADRVGIENDRGNGYDIRTEVCADACRSSPMCPRALRSMRDVRCCLLRFHGEKVRLMRYNVEWKHGGSPCSADCSGYQSLYVVTKDALETWV